MNEGGKEIKYSPIKPGPLNEDVSNSFNGATYTEKVLSANTKMYRVSGGSAGRINSYLSRTYDSLGNVIGKLPGGGNQAYIPKVDERWFW